MVVKKVGKEKTPREMKVHNRIEMCMKMGVCKYAHACASVRAGKCAFACGKRNASTNSY